MTVMQSYSLSLTYTSLRMDVSQTAPATVPTSPENAPVAKTGDTVTLSPEATAPHVVGETAPQVVNETPTSAQPEVSVSEPPSPEVPPAPTSLAGRRAEALLGALDADQDGAVTKEEFLDGAMALLRSVGGRHHHRHVHGKGHDHHGDEGHGMRRLERKLDRLFDRVDGGGDGTVDQAELTDALTKVTREPRPDSTEAPAPFAPETPASATESQPQTPPASAMSCTSVTVVIAVRQYTSVAAMAA